MVEKFKLPNRNFAIFCENQMPRTQVIFYRAHDGSAPVLEWLRDLHDRDLKGWTHVRARIQLLAELGYELRRPAADYVDEGIYELRAKHGHVQFRILYFFHGRAVAVLAHSLTKEDDLPKADIDRARKRKQAFEANPRKHKYEEE
jgi:phage-related protein